MELLMNQNSFQLVIDNHSVSGRGTGTCAHPSGHSTIFVFEHSAIAMLGLLAYYKYSLLIW